MKKPRLVRGFFMSVVFVLLVPASSQQASSHILICEYISNVGAGLLAKATYQAPPTTEACAVRSSCRLPLNRINVAIKPSTAAPLSQMPGAALLSSTWIR